MPPSAPAASTSSTQTAPTVPSSSVSPGGVDGGANDANDAASAPSGHLKLRKSGRSESERILPNRDPTSSPSLLASASKQAQGDYFSASPDASSAESTPTAGAFPSGAGTDPSSSTSSTETPEPTRGQPATPRTPDSPSLEPSSVKERRGVLRKEGVTRSGAPSRKSSASSITFVPSGSQLPQGNHRRTSSLRIRQSSPPHKRFQSHVAFSSFGVPQNAAPPPRQRGDPEDRAALEPPRGPAVVKNNTLSMTLNVRHKGYRVVRRSRTFMAGFDNNEYSKCALQWLLNELVDDGDEIVCLHVVEKDFRFDRDAIKAYEQDAMRLMRRITELNEANRAISIVLEYVFGKLHATFQRIIRMYQPGMLIVGTRGRSLGGLQALVNTRTSFSKYCLQYSPVPVVVVRPTDKRMKKRDKRAGDTTRRAYASMLRSTGCKHETDIASAASYRFETAISADEEAHHVASVLGLPAKFDPTVKPISPASLLRHGGPSLYIHPATPSATPSVAGSQAGSVPPSPTGTGLNDSDEEDEDEEGEFEVMTGEQALAAMTEQKKEKLHKMEMNEAAALRSHGDMGDEEEE